MSVRISGLLGDTSEGLAYGCYDAKNTTSYKSRVIEVRDMQEARKAGNALIAREILQAHPEVSAGPLLAWKILAPLNQVTVCLPITFNIHGAFSSLDGNSPATFSVNTGISSKKVSQTHSADTSRCPAHYALWLRFSDGTDTILHLR
ncbi:hypothetical protein CC86DRAFT_410167 [Ophiobolus disseminans]|uniref:Uncharacterized protein n=1 Tax=Ophiobolus disseminans TaxID=1469910 RepID=A0A6A6ZNX6_9PLEO|nr:hypothetical protein CC86DRAFT_410167 [Ophiobolus disseminans]